MKKSIALILSVYLLLLFTACSEKQPAEEETITPPLQLSTLLTADEVTEATGIAVTQPQQFTDGSAGYFSDDQTEVAYVAAKEATVAEFDDMVTAFSSAGELTDAPNLGEKAVWCEGLVDLLVYANGWALDIRVEYATDRPNDSLLAARQLAALLIEKI